MNEHAWAEQLHKLSLGRILHRRVFGMNTRWTFAHFDSARRA